MVGKKPVLIALTILTVIFGIFLWIPAFLFLGALLMSDGPPIFSIQRLGPAAMGYTLLGAVSSFVYNLVSQSLRGGSLVSGSAFPPFLLLPYSAEILVLDWFDAVLFSCIVAFH